MASEIPCMKDRNHGICCCNCRWLAMDFSHPDTDGGSPGNQRGWVCLAPEFSSEDGRSHVFSQWSLHGACEMWDELKAEKAGGE